MTAPEYAANKTDFIRHFLNTAPDASHADVEAAWKTAGNSDSIDKGHFERTKTYCKVLAEWNPKAGMFDFLSAEAKATLEQYQYIEQLLGPTMADWQWPGTHCEVLLREVIRKHLPKRFSVDKGYIHGASGNGAAIERCPEIDILIHDTEQYAPIFRMDDFAIVMPEAVAGIVQVKRTLTSATLKEGLNNIVAAKRHVKNTCQYNASTKVERLFSALVTFEDEVQGKEAGNLSTSYQTSLAKHMKDFADGFLLPAFVGSLRRCFLLFRGVNVNCMYYSAFESFYGEKNGALQAFIHTMQKMILEPWQYPGYMYPDDFLGFKAVKVHEGPGAPPSQTPATV